MARPAEVAVETIERPDQYTRHQIQTAIRIAHALQRGRLILCEPSQGHRP